MKRVCPIAQNFVTEIKYFIQPAAYEKHVGKAARDAIAFSYLWILNRAYGMVIQGDVVSAVH